MMIPLKTSACMRQGSAGRVGALCLLRCLLGVWLLYSGFVKGTHPVEFLKVIHEYDLPLPFYVLNAAAAWVPWFEVVCGLLLISGRMLPGTALVCVGMLTGFTLLVLQRAWALHGSLGGGFCDVRFDCGCGTGEIGICSKLAENGLMILAGVVLLYCRRGPAVRRSDDAV